MFSRKMALLSHYLLYSNERAAVTLKKKIIGQFLG
jgi:hypothetical protein